MLYRSLTTGLLAACLILLARRSEPVVIKVARPQPVLRPPLRLPQALSVIDVAPGLHGGELARLVHLAPDERILEVNDKPMADELEAGAAIGWPTTTSYVDLTVGGRGLSRRVLLILH